MSKMYKWTVEFEVSDVWVADGFLLTNERALDMLAAELNYANPDTELRARVVKMPNAEALSRERGEIASTASK